MNGSRPLILAMLAALVSPGCVTVSPSARSHALGQGELRLGGALGLSRPLGSDVSLARPADSDPDTEFSPLAVAPLAETHAFYGLGEGVDVGLRVRLPLSPVGWQAGAKLETMIQLLSQPLRGDPFSLGVALGLDAVYRPYGRRHELHTAVTTSGEYGHTDQLEPDGGFNLSYRGGMADVTLIAARRLGPVGELFGGLRGGYLLLDATQRYEPEDPGFAVVEYDKEVREFTFGWVGGFSIEVPPGRRVRMVIVPQLFGYTLQLPDHGWEHQLGGSLELAIRF